MRYAVASCLRGERMAKIAHRVGLQNQALSCLNLILADPNDDVTHVEGLASRNRRLRLGMRRSARLRVVMPPFSISCDVGFRFCLSAKGAQQRRSQSLGWSGVRLKELFVHSSALARAVNGYPTEGDHWRDGHLITKVAPFCIQDFVCRAVHSGSLSLLYRLRLLRRQHSLKGCRFPLYVSKVTILSLRLRLHGSTVPEKLCLLPPRHKGR